MKLDQLFDEVTQVSSPPPGAVNVRIGDAVEGPGGRWVPCVTTIGPGAYIPCVFEVGPGRRQVCGGKAPSPSEEEALSRAIDLALTAAA